MLIVKVILALLATLNFDYSLESANDLLVAGLAWLISLEVICDLFPEAYVSASSLASP